MPYVVPTAAELKARFPEFADVADPQVTIFISAAVNEVEPAQYIEKYYTPAIIYLAAHYMWLYQQQLLINANAVSGGGSGGGGEEGAVQTYLSTMRWEDFQVDFRSSKANTTGGGSTSTWSATMGNVSPLYGRSVYGQLYVELRKRNLPSVVLIG